MYSSTALIPSWKKYVFDRAEEIDKSKEQDWYSLALGFALGKGRSPDEAHAFANHIRYKTDYG